MFNIQLSNKTRRRPPFGQAFMLPPRTKPTHSCKTCGGCLGDTSMLLKRPSNKVTSIYLQYTNLVLAMKVFLSGHIGYFRCHDMFLLVSRSNCVPFYYAKARPGDPLPGMYFSISAPRTRAGPFSDTIALHHALSDCGCKSWNWKGYYVSGEQVYEMPYLNFSRQGF